MLLAIVTNVTFLNFKVTAVAARELNDAKEFAKKHDIPKAYGSYEELTKDPELGIHFYGNFCRSHICLLNYSCKL